jgi:hypothetical protein
MSSWRRPNVSRSYRGGGHPVGCRISPPSQKNKTQSTLNRLPIGSNWS